MATRFYLRYTDSPVPLDILADAGWEDAADLWETGKNRAITKTSSSSDAMATFAHVGRLSTNADVPYKQYVSEPLTAAQTITGAQSIKFQVRASETTASNNLFTALGIRVMSAGGVLRKTVLAVSRDATELAVGTLTNRQFAATSETGNYTTVAGDYLVIEIGVGGDPSTINVHSGSFRLGDAAGSDLPEDDTDTTDLNPWVELVTDTLTFTTTTLQNLSKLIGYAVSGGVSSGISTAKLVAYAVTYELPPSSGARPQIFVVT
jgi:hypothetical protein